MWALVDALQPTRGKQHLRFWTDILPNGDITDGKTFSSLPQTARTERRNMQKVEITSRRTSFAHPLTLCLPFEQYVFLGTLIDENDTHLVEKQWTRLIRFIAAETSEVHIGEPIDKALDGTSVHGMRFLVLKSL